MSIDPGAEVLGSGGDEPMARSHAAPRSRPRWVLPAVGASVLMLGVAGAGVALGVLVSGGGTQPEELVPADALFYADVDFDPAAGQKANLVRLLNKFPDVRDELGGRDDIKTFIVEALAGDDAEDADEILGWLGERAGFAVIPGESDQSVAAVAVIAVTDETAARASLDDDIEPEQLAFESGYAIITSDVFDVEQTSTLGQRAVLPAAEVVSEAMDASLADEPKFQGVLEPLGDGLASMYVDLTGISAMATKVEGALGQPGLFTGSWAGFAEGQAGAIVRVDPSAIEVVGRTSEPMAAADAGSGELFSQLPEDTAFAVDVVGAGEQVRQQWDLLLDQLDQLSQFGGATALADQISLTTKPPTDPRTEFEREVAKFEAQFNVQIPEDLATVLGEEFVFAVSGSGLIEQVPGVGMRSLTDPTEAADLAGRLQSLINDLTGGFGVTLLPIDDGLVVASTPEYADTLATGGGGILDNPNVARALPDLENPDFDRTSLVLWVDFDVIGDVAGLAAPDADDDVEPLEGFGVTVSSDDDGQTARARLTFDE